MEKKTIEEYIKNPSLCPFCGSEDISGGSIEVDSGGAWQEVCCANCSNNWYDLYQLVGYKEVS